MKTLRLFPLLALVFFFFQVVTAQESTREALPQQLTLENGVMIRGQLTGDGIAPLGFTVENDGRLFLYSSFTNEVYYRHQVYAPDEDKTELHSGGGWHNGVVVYGYPVQAGATVEVELDKRIGLTEDVLNYQFMALLLSNAEIDSLPALKYDTDQSITLSEEMPLAFYTFEGQTGDMLQPDALSDNVLAGVSAVTEPDDPLTSPLMLTNALQNEANQWDRSILRADGTYLLVVRPLNAAGLDAPTSVRLNTVDADGMNFPYYARLSPETPEVTLSFDVSPEQTYKLFVMPTPLSAVGPFTGDIIADGEVIATLDSDDLFPGTSLVGDELQADRVQLRLQADNSITAPIDLQVQIVPAESTSS